MLRPYQEEAVKAIHNEWDSGRKNVLLVLPTGTGKTVCFSQVVSDQISDGSRALIIAHRGELLEQAADKLRINNGVDSALEKAESSSLNSMFPVTIASVQSLSQINRLNKFPKDYFKTIVVDEAHHAMSDSYQRVLQHFDTAKVLGVTATPSRNDQRNLGQFFECKAYEYTMRQAIKDGYLCPVKAQMIPLEVNISNVGLSNGDYAAGEIGDALEPYLNQIVLEMLNYCKGRKTVVFLPLVKTSQKFCELLNLHGFRAAEVNGKSIERKEILEDFEKGEYDVLCNSANLILTDPPYGVSFCSSAGLKIQNDSLKNEDFYNFLLKAFKNMVTHVEAGASAYIFHADTEGLNFRTAFVDAGFHLAGCCIWKKDSLVLGRSDYQWQHEPVLYGFLKNGKHNWYSDRKQTTIWEFAKPKRSENHPTSKPLDLLSYPIKNSSQENAIVIDTFGGSGSTLMACELTNRICYTMELDEKYASVILRRYVENGGNPEGVYCIRNGEKVMYDDVVKKVDPKNSTL